MCYAKVLLKRFYLNGSMIRFRPQIEKLEYQVILPQLGLGLKGFNLLIKDYEYVTQPLCP